MNLVILYVILFDRLSSIACFSSDCHDTFVVKSSINCTSLIFVFIFCPIYSVLNSEQQKRLDEQWNSLTFQPSASQQPSWKTSNHFSSEKDPLTKVPISSKGQSLHREPFNFSPSVFSSPNIYGNESKRDITAVSLNDIPLPPKPDFLMQSKENDNLETFNIKRADPGPVESLRTARPYLASPREFLSQSKAGRDSGLSSNG